MSAGSSGPRIVWRGLARCGLALAALSVVGCVDQTKMDFERRIAQLEYQVAERDKQILAQKVSLDEVHRQLAVARAISEDDLKRIFYPERIELERLSGGFDADGRPGDDGVTVYLRPLDRVGDVIKVAGDVRIQLFDLAAPPERNLIGEYYVPVDQITELWHGKLATNFYAIKCPWPAGPPEHAEVTVRATFVDYLTKRVLSAQSVCKVKLPPSP